MKALTKYLLFSFAVILVYTVIEFVTSMHTGLSHDTLTTCLYTFFGTEVAACCLIRIIDRDKKEQNSEPVGPEFDGSMDDIQEDDEVYG